MCLCGATINLAAFGTPSADKAVTMSSSHHVHIPAKRRYCNNNGSAPLFGSVAHYAFVSALSRPSQCGQETSEPLFRLFLSLSIAAYCLHSIVRSSSEGTLLWTESLVLSLRMFYALSVV